MTVKKSIMSAAVFYGLGMLGTACAADKITATFSTNGFAFLPPLVADAMELYSKEDIEADLVTTGGDGKALAALVGGGADVAFLAAPTVLRAHENNIPVKMVGYVLAQYPTDLVMSATWAKQHNISPTSSFKDKAAALKGTTLGITSPGSGTDLIMRYMAKAAGLNPDRDLTLSTLGSSQTIGTAFAQGRIDGFALSAPAPETAIARDGAVLVVNFSAGAVEELSGILYTGITFRQDMIDNKPDLVVRFLRTQQQAIDAIHDPAQTSRARDATWQKYYPKIDKPMFDQMWANWTNAWPRSIVMPDEALQKAINFNNLVDTNKLDPEKAKAATDNSLAQKAVADR